MGVVIWLKQRCEGLLDRERWKKKQKQKRQKAHCKEEEGLGIQHPAWSPCDPGQAT